MTRSAGKGRKGGDGSRRRGRVSRVGRAEPVGQRGRPRRVRHQSQWVSRVGRAVLLLQLLNPKPKNPKP